MDSHLYAKLQGWMGPNYSISTACATSNFCILNAANHIIRGEAVRVFLPFLLSHKSVGFLYQCSRILCTALISGIFETLQDMMLCGGSDAAIIPIGIFCLRC